MWTSTEAKNKQFNYCVLHECVRTWVQSLDSTTMTASTPKFTIGEPFNWGERKKRCKKFNLITNKKFLSTQTKYDNLSLCEFQKSFSEEKRTQIYQNISVCWNGAFLLFFSRSGKGYLKHIFVSCCFPQIRIECCVVWWRVLTKFKLNIVKNNLNFCVYFFQIPSDVYTLMKFHVHHKVRLMCICSSE